MANKLIVIELQKRITIDPSLKRQLEISAQYLGMDSADTLATIVLRAFLEMHAEQPNLSFPLMLQQVPSLEESLG